MSLVKSKQRVADQREIFTPHEMSKAMLHLVKGEIERIDSLFLESDCKVSAMREASCGCISHMADHEVGGMDVNSEFNTLSRTCISSQRKFKNES